MLYLVDGYNVTHSDPATSKMDPEGQREALVSRVAARHTHLFGAGRIVIVFDGPEAGGVSAGRRGPVETRFSRGESADDVIVRLAGAEPGQVTVVSSDTALADRVRNVAGSRSHIWPRERLFERSDAKRHGGGSRKGYPGRAVGLPPGANRITQELKDLWLTEDEE